MSAFDSKICLVTGAGDAVAFAKSGARVVLCDVNEESAHRTAADITTVLALGERLAQPGQVADAALFPASDAASFINGAIVPVDGGLTRGRERSTS
ncbi:SDR family oxidoreductase [Nonomuraea sp. NPDC003201]